MKIGILIGSIMLVLGVMLIFFKKDTINKNTSSKWLNETSGFVVCIIALVIIYVFNR